MSPSSNPLNVVEDQHWTRERIELVRQAVAQRATDAELAMFIHQCKSLGLDPLQKELVFTKYDTKHGPRVSFITTRDGYLKAAMQSPDYRGLQAMPVKEGDAFEVVDPKESAIKHSFGSKRGKLLGAWAIAYHAKRTPVIFWADFAEYYAANANSTTWSQYPSAMIQKVAEVGALRRQFNISGVVAQEEGLAAPDSSFENVSMTGSGTGTPSHSGTIAAPDDGIAQPQLTSSSAPEHCEPQTNVQPAPAAPQHASGKKLNPETDQPKTGKVQTPPAQDQPESTDPPFPIYTVKGTRIRKSNNKAVLQLALEDASGKVVQAFAPEGPVMDKIDALEAGEGTKVAAQLEQNGKIMEIKDIRRAEAGEGYAAS